MPIMYYDVGSDLELITMCFVTSMPSISNEELLIGQSLIAYNSKT